MCVCKSVYTHIHQQAGDPCKSCLHFVCMCIYICMYVCMYIQQQAGDACKSCLHCVCVCVLRVDVLCVLYAGLHTRRADGVCACVCLVQVPVILVVLYDEVVGARHLHQLFPHVVRHEGRVISLCTKHTRTHPISSKHTHTHTICSSGMQSGIKNA